MKHKTPLVWLLWVDSVQPIPSWANVRDRHDEEREPLRCESVGWLIRRDKRVHVLAPNLAPRGADDVQCSGVITIPTCAVVKMRRLPEPK